VAIGSIWQQFQQLIFQALLYLEGITHDWGMAIILLTLAIRIVLLPLTWKQTKSMVEMQRVQPKLKALQEKYKDDKEKLQEETLKFYSENKVNPFGGCLPLLLQFPVLIALYRVLGGTTARPGIMMKYLAGPPVETASFYNILPNLVLSPKEVWALGDIKMFIPYILLVILFAVSIWLPQALMPGDKQQKMIGGYMAIVMLYFGWISPAGVLLYWDVSSVFGVVQQQITMGITKRELAQRESDAAAEKLAEKAKKKPGRSAPAEIADKKPANQAAKKQKS
jgi:YidC/Oxa1 family membrane protein insertase